MRGLPMGALLVVCLGSVAGAQPPPPKRLAPKNIETMRTQIPQLYRARVVALINKAVPQRPATAVVRVYFDPTGAITEVSFLSPSKQPEYNQIIEHRLSAFASTAKRRLPVPRDPKLRERILREGVVAIIGGAARKPRIPLSKAALSVPAKSLRSVLKRRAPQPTKE